MIKVLSYLILILVTSSSFATNIIVYDAGEGLLAKLKTKNFEILIDTGSLINIRDNLSKIKSKNTKLTDLILTHLHPDHASGVFEIVENYPQIRIYDNCMININVEDGDLIRWTDEFLGSIENRMCLKSGSKLNFDTIKIDVLWPTGSFRSKDHNYYSLVLKIRKKKTTILIMGDALRATEEWLIKNQLDNIKDVDVLVLGHHGSDHASSKKFLDIVNPSIAVVPVNKNNVRGYPSPATIERLKENGIKMWVTGYDGDFKLDLK